MLRRPGGYRLASSGGRLLNSLFFGVAKFGAKAWTSGETARGLGVVIGVQQVHFTLDHPAAKANRHGEWDVREGAAGELRLEVLHLDAPGRTRVWADGAGGKLEDQLTELAAGLVVAGEINYRSWLVESYERVLARRAQMQAELLKRQAERERQDAARRAAEAQARRAALRGHAQGWREAADLRAFIAAVEAAPPAGLDVAAWARWAREEADLLDPFRNGAVGDLPTGIGPEPEPGG